VTRTPSSTSLRPGTLGLLAALGAAFALCAPARAENAARLVGVGPVSRAMGGTGIAAPQEAIGALTQNPAGLAFRPRPEAVELGFGSSLFFGGAAAKVTVGGQTFRGKDSAFAPVATIGAALPLNEPAPGDGDAPGVRWFGGFSIFAAGGFGVDYRDEDIDQPGFYDLGPAGTAPLIVGEFSRFQALSFAPAIAAQPFDWLALGIALPLTFSTLDLRQGSSDGFSVGAQVGVSVKPHERVLVGATYLTRQKTEFENVIDRNGDGAADDLDVELPEQAGIGLAVEALPGWLLVEVDLKWLHWADAAGFEEADWQDQYVFALGVQASPVDGVFLRAGYNYGRSPINVHSPFDGQQPLLKGGAVVPRYYHETGRTIGNPSFAQHHLTAGAGCVASARTELHLGLLYTLPETVREKGTDLVGQPATIVSKGRYAITVETGITLRF